ncbi:MAG TPA: hypothetical protein VJS37_11835, partial [Terriglobales bacterium]|nr:hypothetical protein [Terriglobales bacterium]
LIHTVTVYMTGGAEILRGGQWMKTFLLLAVGTVITAAVLPSLPAKIILSAFVLLAVLNEAARQLRKQRRNNLKFILEQ